jgi:hypothetical protein
MVREAKHPRSRRIPSPSTRFGSAGFSHHRSLPNNLTLQPPASHFVFMMNHRAFRTLVVLAPERRPKRHSDRDPDSQPDCNVPRQNTSHCTQRGSQSNTQSSKFRIACHNPLQRLAAPGGTAEDSRPTRAIETPTSSLQPPAASASCLQSAAPSLAVLPAASRRASRTTPVPARPSWRCRL